ncbi:MAG TPA: GIY-YIG nuclease family protein [Thermoanaerobaculia bacterium]|nr:GIY-YIG nuclease family protein [Thermoanaerobaculia bacterium]
MPAPKAFVYLISNKSRTLYCGITTDLRQRFEEHRTGAYPNGFTARYHGTRLVWFETADDLSAAAKREKQIKGWPRKRKVRMIEAMNPDWVDLSPRLDPLYWFA